jgi:hypothetical protein
MIEHVGAADIYITPYRQEAQVVSGTLAIALGAGKAIISTPYWHAKEILADGRGVLVPFDDPDSIAAAAIQLLNNDAERHAMRKRAYLYSRNTTWPKTAQAYMVSFQRARIERMLRPRAALQDIFAPKATDTLPALNTSHLLSMTDDTGMLQHAIFSLPNCLEGYTTDDNARALVVTTLLNKSPLPQSDEHAALSHRYLAFLWFAFHEKTGRFRNFLGYDRTWQEEIGSEDSHGGWGAFETSSSLVDKPSGRMETQFTSITEQLIHASPWPPAASAVFSRGWIRIPAHKMKAEPSRLKGDQQWISQV